LRTLTHIFGFKQMTSDTINPEMEVLWKELGEALQQGQKDEAKAVLQRVGSLAEKMISDGDIEGEGFKAGMLFSLGNLESVEGRIEDAVAAFKEAIPHATRLFEERPTVNARDLLGSLHYNLGTYYCDTNQMTEAEEALKTAARYQEANVQEVPNEAVPRTHLAQTRFNLGNLFMATERPQEAAMCFVSSSELWLGLTKEYPDDAAYAHNLARSFFNFSFVAGPTLEAHGAYEKAQTVWEKLLSNHDDLLQPRNDTARCYFNHSVFLAQGGRHEEALVKMERAIEHLDKLVVLAPDETSFQEWRKEAISEAEFLRTNQPAKVVAENLAGLDELATLARQTKNWNKLKEVALGHIELARNLGQANRPVEMEQVSRIGIKLFSELAAHDKTADYAHLEAALCYDLHTDLRSLGRLDAAEEILRFALRRWLQLHSKYKGNKLYQHWLAEAVNNVGILCITSGRTDAAIVAYQNALTMREQTDRRNDDPENKLSMGGILCNLGNAHRSLGAVSTAREFFEKAIKMMDSLRGKKVREQILEQFSVNAREGLKHCDGKSKTLDRSLYKTASVSWAQAGPSALPFDVNDAELAARLRSVDEIRLKGHGTTSRAPDDAPLTSIEADELSEKLVNDAPDCAEAWLLRGLVLGHFLSEEGGELIEWSDERHENSVTAFYEALVLRPDYYEAKLYKGLALRQAAHSAQATLNCIDSLVETLPPAERDVDNSAQYLRRFSADVARATESLEAAALLRPEDGRPLFELAELYHGLGFAEQAQPFLFKLSKIDQGLFDKFQEQLDEDATKS
jgi:tetratricopeptide (TPR) repeat protein